MQPFDDKIPEEQMAQNQPMLQLLRHTLGKAVFLTTEEQAQSLTRVRARLAEAEYPLPKGNDTLPLPIAIVSHTEQPTRSNGADRKALQHGRIVRYINTFAAVLVIGAIIGVSLLLFRHQPSPSVGAPANPPASETKSLHLVVSQAHGLFATMSIPAGPYFLSELLPANITLSNHSQTTYEIQGFPAANFCDEALWLDLTSLSKNARHYTLPPTGFFSCPLRTSQLKPGQTFSVHVYVPLTDSGKVQITEKASFLTATITPNETSITSGPDPLKGHWPTIQITVSTTIPANRAISLQQQGTDLLVNAPPAARSHLLYLYTVDCSNTGSANDYWESVSTTIQEPECGPNVRWTYAVGAPGFAIATKSYP